MSWFTRDPGHAKLHIGSGVWYYGGAGWINVDGDASLKVDVFADALHLPFPDGTFTHVYMGHFLEHIPYHRIPYVIRELLRASVKDVQLAAVGPCMDFAIEQDVGTELLAAIAAHDPPDPDPGAHAWTATARLTEQVMRASGLRVEQVDISSIARPEWPNPNAYARWQCAFLAWRNS